MHRLQPACLVGNNHHQVPFDGEDIQIFERDVPGENKAGLSGQEISRLPLETCQTMNGMWGYKVADQNYKSTTELIRLLVQTSGKGANLLLNIGPQPDGTLPATALSRLSDIGQWLSANGEAIYGTESGGYADGEKVVTTRKGDRLFIHVIDETVGSLNIPIDGKVKSVVSFAGQTPLDYKFRDGHLTMDLTIPADAPDYIIEVTLK